jgi:putative two-component system response regulator
MSLGRQVSILVIDSRWTTVASVRQALSGCCAVHGATDCAIGWDLVDQHRPSVVLIGVELGRVELAAFCRRLRQQTAHGVRPVLFMGPDGHAIGPVQALQMGAADWLDKPLVPQIVRARVEVRLALDRRQQALERLGRQRQTELACARLETLYRLSRAAQLRDNDTCWHAMRMSQYAQRLALAAGLNEYQALLIWAAAPLHDIGKVAVPDEILHQQGSLTEDQWQRIRMHPLDGARLLDDGGQTQLLRVARNIALTHHERWDGEGYPLGLRADDIPIEGRIAAIADVFDALTSWRPYKPAWSVERAVQHLVSQRGAQFDPRLVDRFCAIIPEIEEISRRYADGATDHSRPLHPPHFSQATRREPCAPQPFATS